MVGFGQRHPVLNRSDMYDDAGALLDHRRQERAIEAHGAEEVLVERLVPFRVVEYGEAARRRGGTAHDMNDDVDTAETAEDRVRDGRASFDRRYIGDDEVL